jgi:hypothetical protein
MFLMDWYLSVFTKALPLEVAAQVWDMYLYEGEVYMLCVALGILKMFAPSLSLYGVEKISPFLLHLPENIKIEELFTFINQIHIPLKQYEKVRRKVCDLLLILCLTRLFLTFISFLCFLSTSLSSLFYLVPLLV